MAVQRFDSSDPTNPNIPRFGINFSNDAFPVLSFTFALYCGRDSDGNTFMNIENGKWSDSLKGVITPASPPARPFSDADRPRLGDPSLVYHGYFDFYARNLVRPFPQNVIDLVAVDTPVLGTLDRDDRPNGVGLFKPTLDQALKHVGFLMNELDNTPPAGSEPVSPRGTSNRPPRTPAFADPQHPLLSCLAMIFLNDDPSFRSDPVGFLKGFEFPTSPVNPSQILLDFANSGNRFMTGAQTSTLAPELANELVRRPASW